MPRVYKVIYETTTGEVLPDCELCGVYSFPDEETAIYHFSRLDIKNRSMDDITFEEKLDLSKYDPDKRTARFKVDIGKIQKKLSNRVRVPFTVNEYGISYQDLKPVQAIKENK